MNPLKPLLLILLCLLASQSAAAQNSERREFQSAGGDLSFQHPADWGIFEEAGVIVLANTPEVVAQSQMGPGQVGGFLFHPSVTALLIPPGLTLEDTPGQFLAALNQTAGQDIRYSEPILYDWEGRAAVRVDSYADQSDNLTLAIQLTENDRALLIIGTAHDELPLIEDQVLALAQSLNFTPPLFADPALALPLLREQAYPNYGLEVLAPADWVLGDAGSFITASNAQIVFDVAGKYLPQGVQIAIFPPVSPERLAEALEVPADTPLRDQLQAYVTQFVAPNNPNTTLGAVTFIKLSDREVYRLAAQSDNGDGLYFLVQLADGRLLLAAAGAGLNDMPAYAATLEAMIQALVID
jgi:hypothetical protein